VKKTREERKGGLRWTVESASFAQLCRAGNVGTLIEGTCTLSRLPTFLESVIEFTV